MTKGPGRLKSGAQKKVRRWKKGQSCVTNPTVSRHRQAAASTRFQPGRVLSSPGASSARGGIQLTANALAQLDEATGDVHLSDDASSLGGDTYKTFLSGVSDCSNPAFNKIKRYWESNAASHKEVCAVLAAVTEVIREQGGKETETEYFGALMTALENVDNQESQSAILFLLSLVIKRVPSTVLRLKFSAVSKSLSEVLAACQGQQGTTSLRSCLVCLSTALRQLDYGAWNDASTLQVYRGILSYAIHPKPKIRKAAQHAVCAVLKGSSFMLVFDAPPHHPAAGSTAKFCIQQIESSGGTGEVATTMHVLGLLKDVLPCLPQNSLKSSCETILRLMTLSNVLMTSLCMQALHGMFAAKPKGTSLPAELNAQLINALYDYQPGLNDVQPSQAWLAVMESAHANLARLNQKLCVSHLPRLFTAAMACFLSQKSEITLSAFQALKTLLYECVKPSADWLSAELKGTTGTPVHKMFHTIEGGLSYKYHSSWGLVLQIIRAFFEVIGKEGSHVMRKCLQSMCDLRGTHHFPYTQELDWAVGMAIRSMGPRFVLGVVPLQITGEEDNYDFPRSWLLPVIRDNVCNTELQYFTKYFLPLAAKLKSKSLEFSQEGRNVESKTYDVLQAQIWSLLPGFCKDPVDVVPGFKGIARILGSALSDRSDLRHDVCAALRHLITRNMDNEVNRLELSRYAKNFLPIFFNLYTSGNAREDTSLASVLETAKVYLKIADQKLVIGLFEKLSGKLSDETIDRHPLMDLSIALTQHLDRDHTSEMFQIVSQLLKSSDHTVQKKAYRILEGLCQGATEAGQTFVTSHLQQLQETLATSLSSSSPSSKGARLKCLIHLVRALPSQNQDFVETILPEVILCTKEVNSKTRAAAFDLLVDLARAMIRWSDGKESKEISVRHYIEMLTAGLAGSPHMVSATVQALTRIVFEYRDVVRGEFLAQMMDGVCSLLEAKAREVLSPTLGFVKVLIAILEDVTLAQYVKPLILNIGKMGNTNRRNLRAPIRSIYTRFIRKFGYEMIYKLVPEDHKKMVHNIHKQQERTKRHKAMKEGKMGGEEDEEDEEGNDEASALLPGKPKMETIDELLQDSESDSEGEEESGKGKVKGSKKARGRKQGAAWLKEGKQDETLLDFLDASVSQRVLATKPEEKLDKPARGLTHNFKSMPDGRLIIAEEEAEEEAKTPGAKKRKRGRQAGEGEADELDELMDEELASRKAGRKRKMDDLGISDDEDESPSKYRAGGSGIHRPVHVAATTQQKKEPGMEYKAKKAKGDVKKTNKHDPYAYIPLNRQQLNKRMKAKSSGLWKKLAPKGKKGANQQRNKGHKKR